MKIRLLALSKEEKQCLVLYRALNCLLRHSIRLFEMSSLPYSVFEDLEAITRNVRAEKTARRIIRFLLYGRYTNQADSRLDRCDTLIKFSECFVKVSNQLAVTII